jgi:hypothetical protein
MRNSNGGTGLALDMLKALPEKALEHLTLLIQKFWKGEEDHEVWHTILMAALYKGKINTNNPNNWRGVYLKELTSKVISSIVSTRLLSVIAGNNVEEHNNWISAGYAYPKSSAEPKEST